MSEAYERMQAAEVEYLLESGWVRHVYVPAHGELWRDPNGKYSLGVTQGHAVNIQKQFDRSRPKPAPCPQPVRRLVVEVMEKGAVHYENLTNVDAHALLDAQPALLNAQMEAATQRERGDALMREVENRDTRICALSKQVASLEKQLHDTEDEFAKSRAYIKSRAAEHAILVTKTEERYTDVCLDRNKLYNLNKELSSELLMRKEQLHGAHALLEDSKRRESNLQKQVAELADEDFLWKHMTLTRKKAAADERVAQLEADLKECDSNRAEWEHRWSLAEATVKSRTEEMLEREVLHKKDINRIREAFNLYPLSCTHAHLTRGDVRDTIEDLRVKLNMAAATEVASARSEWDGEKRKYVEDIKFMREDLKRMMEDRQATSELLKQSLDRILHSAETK